MKADSKMARFLGQWGVTAPAPAASRPPDGSGPVGDLPSPVPVAETHIDPEAYATIYNAGFEDCVSQELADDPENAREWLEGRLARERYYTLRKYAQIAEERGDLAPVGDLRAMVWLTVCADAEMGAAQIDPTPIDLHPFQQAADAIGRMARDSGGGVADAYNNAVSLLRSAFDQYKVEADR